jgi:hypothetical protein
MVDLPLVYLSPWLSTHANADEPLNLSTVMHLRDSHVNQNYRFKPSASPVRVFVSDGAVPRFRMSSGRHLLATLFTEPFAKWLFSQVTLDELTNLMLTHNSSLVSRRGKLSMAID